MAEIKAKRTIYNSVFVDLFSDPENQLRLYRDLHPEDTETRVEDISNVTLKPVLTDQMYNDLGFTVKGRTIFLVEAQSTWCENITLRTMLYTSNSFREYVLSTKQNYYHAKTVKLPKPELYVIYTGAEKHDEEYMSMAEAYWDGDDSVIEVKVKVIHTKSSDEILAQYTAFCEIYRENRAKYGETAEAVEKTINECICGGILKEYLTKRRSEVMDIMTALFDDDVIQEMYENSLREEGRKEGEKIGRKEGEKIGREEGEKIGEERGSELRGYDAVTQLVESKLADEREACEILNVNYEGYKAYKAGESQ